MTLRTKKLVGTLILFAFLVLYVLLAMAIAIVMGVNKIGWLTSLVYHAAAGLLWVPIAAYIIWWMQQEPKPRA
ncbi:MAG: DUF2842 domain-containing protein [Hyphomicrobiaceae bacterium]|nr:DUF2842 domain-containing protein [Hyphomicrobiaceae bacterium]